ncbi:hypothetical protein, partial [Escherichia coli]|uniref:hypothetical protein n=1 Tax=Escherichia coli TaxID=562 RepID=UPI0019D232E5
TLRRPDACRISIVFLFDIRPLRFSASNWLIKASSVDQVVTGRDSPAGLKLISRAFLRLEAGAKRPRSSRN